MEKIFNLLLFLLLFQGVRAQDYDLYLCIGQSNMAGRGTLTEETSGAIPDVYLFNDRNEFEKATNPLNRYSTIRKELKMQGVGPAYSFAKTMATQTGRKIGLVVNARGGSSIQSNLPGLFFVAGEIAFWAPNGQASENIRAFNEMISHISDFIPNTACVSSEGLMPLIDYSDPHFCTDSQIVLGERYAQKVLENTSGLRVLFIGDSITDGNWGNVCSPKPSSERSLGDMNHIYGSGYMYLCASYYQGNYPEKSTIF